MVVSGARGGGGCAAHCENASMRTACRGKPPPPRAKAAAATKKCSSSFNTPAVVLLTAGQTGRGPKSRKRSIRWLIRDDEHATGRHEERIKHKIDSESHLLPADCSCQRAMHELWHRWGHLHRWRSGDRLASPKQIQQNSSSLQPLAAGGGHGSVKLIARFVM